MDYKTMSLVALKQLAKEKNIKGVSGFRKADLVALLEEQDQKNQIEKETADAMRAEYNKVANSTNKDTIKAAKDKIKQIEEEGDTKIKLIDKERTYVENV